MRQAKSAQKVENKESSASKGIRRISELIAAWGRQRQYSCSHVNVAATKAFKLRRCHGQNSARRPLCCIQLNPLVSRGRTETHNTEHAGIRTSMQTASSGFLILRTRCLEDPRRFWMQLAGPLSSTPTKSLQLLPGMQCRSLSCLSEGQLGSHPCGAWQSAGPDAHEWSRVHST